MSFKDMVAADLHGVFLNVCEFAERRTVIYDGQTFDGADHGGIPVLLIQVKETEKPVRNTQGFFGVQAKLYAALSDLCGELPEQGQRISVEDGEALGKKFYTHYKIITAACSGGMVCLELEGYDE